MKEHEPSETKRINFDRALLVAVLAIQAGLAGWFFHCTAQQQRTPTRKPTTVRTASPRPVSLAQADPVFLPPDQDRLTRHPSGASLVPLTPLSFSDISSLVPRQGPMPDPTALMAGMQQRIEESMQAFQRMHHALMHDDWLELGTSPTLDMREYADRYEVIFCVPDLDEGNVQAHMQEGQLSILVRCDNPEQRQLFQSRVLLPWALTNASTMSTRVEQGSLVVSIPR